MQPEYKIAYFGFETILYDSTQWDLSFANKIVQTGPCVQILGG